MNFLHMIGYPSRRGWTVSCGKFCFATASFIFTQGSFSISVIRFRKMKKIKILKVTPCIVFLLNNEIIME